VYRIQASLLPTKNTLQAFYWGTSEWSAEQIEEAFREYIFSSSRPKSMILTIPYTFLDVAHTLGLIAPVAEQCQHSMLQRERPEKEYAYVYLLVYAMSNLRFLPYSPGTFIRNTATALPPIHPSTLVF